MSAKLDRRTETVNTPFGEVVVKLGLKGGRVVQVAPEYESARLAAGRADQPLRVIYESATRAWHAQDDRGGQ